MNYLGIDISKATVDAALLIGERVKHKKFDNNSEGFGALLEWLNQHSSDEVRVCMEATGKYWEALAEFFFNENFFVSVCNPTRIKGFWKSELKRSKTDKLDAALIARFCRALNPVQWRPMNEQQRALRDTQRYVASLIEQRAQEKNRLKAGELEPIVQKAIKDHLQFLKLQIEELQNKMLAMIHSNKQLDENFALLTSITGVGPSTAVTFLGELGSVERFPNARALEVFCGVAPRLFESGTSVKARSRMSKIGSSSVRKAFYMPAIAASTHNPVFKKFKSRLKEAGKPGRVIICAIMRKLIRLMFSILKSRKPFDPAHLSEHKPSKLAAC